MENDKKRNDIRLALARRMKIDLIQSEEEKQFETFSYFDKKLKEADRLRKDNKERETQLTNQFHKQKQYRS